MAPERIGRDQGKVLTVVVTATKGDLPPGTATSEGVTVKFASKTTLSLTKNAIFSWQTTPAKVTVKGPPSTPVTVTSAVW